MPRADQDLMVDSSWRQVKVKSGSSLAFEVVIDPSRMLSLSWTGVVIELVEPGLGPTDALSVKRPETL